MTLTDFALRIACAFVLGSIVGLERQWRQRMAGLRTNALVATGAALFCTVTPLVGDGSNPTQIPAYVIGGIGFLAGGVIFKERMSVSGLNTAATIWCTAAIGVLAGLGEFSYAAVGTAIVLFANVVLRPIARRINRAPAEDSEIVSSYEVRAVCREDVENDVRSAVIAAIRGDGMVLQAVYSDDLEPRGRVEVIADVVVNGRADAKLEKVVSRVGIQNGVSAVSWKAVPTGDEERALAAEAEA